MRMSRTLPPTSEAVQKELNPDPPSSDIKWDKYHVLSWEEEQAANEVERALQEASIALAHAEQTVDMAAYYSGEWKNSWVKLLEKEYEQMHGVLEEVLRKDAREKLGLASGDPLPREIPSKLL